MATYAHKKQQLYLVLSGIFLVNALLAEIIGVKIFSVEKTFGLSGNLTAGVLVWPVVFISTDVINEYFGRKGVLRITFLTVGLILYAFLVILGTTKLVPADFWLDLNKTDAQGRPFNIEFAYQSIFRQGLGIIYRFARGFCDWAGARCQRVSAVSARHGQPVYLAAGHGLHAGVAARGQLRSALCGVLFVWQLVDDAGARSCPL